MKTVADFVSVRIVVVARAWPVAQLERGGYGFSSGR
jgi:hypothetical protein